MCLISIFCIFVIVYCIRILNQTCIFLMDVLCKNCVQVHLLLEQFALKFVYFCVQKTTLSKVCILYIYICVLYKCKSNLYIFVYSSQNVPYIVLNYTMT